APLVGGKQATHQEEKDRSGHQGPPQEAVVEVQAVGSPQPIGAVWVGRAPTRERPAEVGRGAPGGGGGVSTEASPPVGADEADAEVGDVEDGHVGLDESVA
ncbi:unnamed protein product, partial [Ectocarpus sp. 12 AP-2014]